MFLIFQWARESTYALQSMISHSESDNLKLFIKVLMIHGFHFYYTVSNKYSVLQLLCVKGNERSNEV